MALFRIKFRYTNWRGDEHEYVIEPDPYQTWSVQDGDLMLNGFVVTRDGDVRSELGERRSNRRRSFRLVDIKDPKPVKSP